MQILSNIHSAATCINNFLIFKQLLRDELALKHNQRKLSALTVNFTFTKLATSKCLLYVW